MNAIIYQVDESPIFVTNVTDIGYDYDRNELTIVGDEGKFGPYEMESDVLRVEFSK